MKNQWKRIKTAVLLAMLPLVATAAASAHQWMNENAPITNGLEQSAIAAEVSELGTSRIHTVVLNNAGAIEGRIASIDRDTKSAQGLSELKIFFVRDGKIAQETVTAEDGTFMVQGVAEGAYSFVATGSNGFAAYGVRVVANDGTAGSNVMEAAAVSPRLAVVKQILEQQLPGNVSSEILANSANDSSNQLVGANRVRLENGTLTGHVVPVIGSVEMVKGTLVHILKNDEQVAEVLADEKGVFMVDDLEPGVYDFVAAGPSGFAAVSFEAVAQTESATTPAAVSVAEPVQVDSEDVPVAVGAAAQDMIATDMPMDSGMGYSDSLDVCLTCGQDSGMISSQMDYGYSDMSYAQSAPIEYAGQSVGCGAAAGGSCGSCGDFSGYDSCGGAGGGGLFRGGRLFGGSGGGLGRLLLLGGIAGGIVAIADNPNDPTPTSPSS